jgi:hypothetical protein
MVSLLLHDDMLFTSFTNSVEDRVHCHYGQLKQYAVVTSIERKKNKNEEKNEGKNEEKKREKNREKRKKTRRKREQKKEKKMRRK